MATVRQWLSVKDLAEELGVPVRTVYRWRARRTGPRGHRLGKHVRFRRSDVDAWLAARIDPAEPHLIEFRAGGFTIQHPLRCRPNLFACEVNRVGEELPGPPQRGVGVYECDLQDGVLVVGRQVRS